VVLLWAFFMHLVSDTNILPTDSVLQETTNCYVARKSLQALLEQMYEFVFGGTDW